MRLRVLIPAVENAISGTAFRPGDVLRAARATVEIGNTDAEGRLILADALALADEEKPELLLDFATLTGAARVALGPDLPPFFTDDDASPRPMRARRAGGDDPVWRMPLWAPYRACSTARSPTSTTSRAARSRARSPRPCSCGASSRTRPWAHIDIFAWNPSTKPGRPEGGEVQTRPAGLRAPEGALRRLMRLPRRRGRCGATRRGARSPRGGVRPR